MYNIKKTLLIILTLLSISILQGCGNQQQTQGANQYSVYYLNREDTKINAFDYYTDTTDDLELAEELIEVMSTIPDDVNFHEPVHNFSVIGYSINENQILLSVDDNYKNLDATTEVLTRAAIVRTLTQIKGIEYVTMKVREQELVDNMGTTIGMMSASQFVDNAGNEINSYEKVKLTLYFTSEEGDYLIKANRTVVYNSNISMEKLVVEQLIGGPTSDEIFPTINPNTKVVNVTVTDGICYVNLDEEFLNQVSNVSADVTIYSIVNSLVELPNVNKVQISINGETDVVFHEIYNLKTVFERDLDMLNEKE